MVQSEQKLRYHNYLLGYHHPTPPTLTDEVGGGRTSENAVTLSLMLIHNFRSQPVILGGINHTGIQLSPTAK